VDIIKHIYDYLMEHNTSVIVPELGCFSIVNKPSEIRDGVVSPPVKTVEFDCNISDDDHVLTQYIAKKENTTNEQVVSEIQTFYNQFFINKLTYEKEISFEGFGTFSQPDFANMIFTPDANFFKDNYGLGQAQISGNLDPSDTTRFRVKEHQPKYRQEPPPEKPGKPAKTPPPPKKKSEKTKTGSSSLWVLWVLLIAVALGVGGYFAYPYIQNKTRIPKISEIFDNLFQRTVTIVAVEPETESTDTDETDQNTSNTEVAQTLDDTTDKKNALKPDNQQQTTSKPAPAVYTGNAGQGRYVLIIASLAPRSEAERFGRKLQADGINYEIIPAVVEGVQRYRISVASFDDKAEAVRQANQMKSQKYCENVWVASR